LNRKDHGVRGIGLAARGKAADFLGFSQGTVRREMDGQS
jgi:hypothetical protein